MYTHVIGNLKIHVYIMIYIYIYIRHLFIHIYIYIYINNVLSPHDNRHLETEASV